MIPKSTRDRHAGA